MSDGRKTPYVQYSNVPLVLAGGATGQCIVDDDLDTQVCCEGATDTVEMTVNGANRFTLFPSGALQVGATTTATGFASFAAGSGSDATGTYSTAMGLDTTAGPGDYSHAIGRNGTAADNNSYCWSDGTIISTGAVGEYLIRAGGQVRINNGAATELSTATSGTQTTWTYTPATPADWTVPPTTIAQALDQIAAALGPI